MDYLLISIGSIFLLLFGLSYFILKQESKTNNEYQNIEKFSVNQIVSEVEDIFDSTQKIFSKAKELAEEVPKLIDYLDDIPKLLLNVLLDGLKKIKDPIKDFFLDIIPEFMTMVFKIIVKIGGKIFEFIKKEVPEIKYVLWAMYGFGLLQLYPIIMLSNRIVSILVGPQISTGLILGGIILLYQNFLTVFTYLVNYFISLIMNLDYKDITKDIAKFIVSEVGSLVNRFLNIIKIF